MKPLIIKYNRKFPLAYNLGDFLGNSLIGLYILWYVIGYFFQEFISYPLSNYVLNENRSIIWEVSFITFPFTALLIYYLLKFGFSKN